MADQPKTSHRKSTKNAKAYPPPASSAPSSASARAGSTAYNDPQPPNLTPYNYPGQSATTYKRGEQSASGSRSASNNGAPYNDPAVFKTYIGDAKPLGEYGSTGQMYTVNRVPASVRQAPSPFSNPPRAAASVTPPAYYANVVPWPMGNGNRSVKNSYAMEAYIKDRDDPYGYAYAPRRSDPSPR